VVRVVKNLLNQLPRDLVFWTFTLIFCERLRTYCKNFVSESSYERSDFSYTFIHIKYYSFTFTNVHKYSLMFIYIHLCSTRFIYVRLCSFLFILVHDKKLINLFSNFILKLNVLRISTNVLKKYFHKRS